jgi:hypothetical protein
MLAAAHALAAPAIGNLSLRGLQTGATTALVVDGSELGPDARLLTDFPLAGQTQKAGATASRVEFEVKLDAQVPPGIYSLRIAGPSGVSPPMLIAVDALQQLPLAAEVQTLPVAFTGALNGSIIQTTAFTGKKAQRVVVEIESRRLGANLNPIVHLYDSRHVQVAWGQGRSSIAGDARLDVSLPADGHYTVEVHDLLFRGADPGFFRLKIGDFKYADLVYPLGVTRGAQTSLEFVASNLPAELKSVVNPVAAGEEPAPWPAGVPLISGSRPKVFVTLAEVVEAPPADKPQEVPAAPVAINGRLGARKEQDRYRIAVTPGQKLMIEVFASRVGSPLDGVLVVATDAGAQLGTSDDRPGTSDPGLEVTVPADAHGLIVSLRDLENRGGADYVYRIAVQPAGQPNFRLSAAEESWLVPKDGAMVVRVKADRSGYDGPIQLILDPQPQNLVLTQADIPAGASETLLSLSAPGLAPVQALARLVGKSTDPATPLERPLVVGNSTRLDFQPWLRNEVAVAVTPPGPLSVTWNDLPPGTKLQGGAPLPLNIRVARAAGTTGAVSLSLLTTQPMPKKTIKENNKDKSVDDVDNALRLESQVIIAADQSEAAAKLLVPVEMPLALYDLAIKAELLAADNKTAVATAMTGSRRMPFVPGEKPAVLAVFEDQPEFVTNLKLGSGQATLEPTDKFSGGAAVKVTPDQRYSEALPGLGVKIRERPAAGEYRYLQFAWRKQGGQSICLQLNHDGHWGPIGGNASKFRYHAGPGPECFGASVVVSPTLPAAFALVTRDLFADFGEFTLTGLALSPVDGEFAVFDHIYLAKAQADFDLVKP